MLSFWMIFSMASRNTLERLRRLDSSSPKYHNLLGQFLSGDEYKLWVPALRGEDLLRFVDYLDSVRLHVILPHSLLKLA